ncbi:MAG TPA: hypothetical protein ENH94_09805 [Phycisphaerales bacterium]|nr:hypothetical protein [Phycisphaerales bacterium]
MMRKSILAALCLTFLLCSTLQADPFSNVADINNDRRVDFTDFSLLAAAWQSNDSPTANWNPACDIPDANDGVINGFDLSILSTNWLWSSDISHFAYIPGGTFEMGDHSGIGDTDELIHTVTLSSFYMGKHEVTNGQYAGYLNSSMSGGDIKVVSGVVYAVSDGSNSDPYFSTTSAPNSSPDYGQYSQIDYSGGIFSSIIRDSNSMAEHPVLLVSWYGATAYCDHYGYRLPTEAEWEYAARGGAYYYVYPWGSDSIDQTLANYYDGDFANPLGLTSYPYTAVIGYYGEHGGYGLSDMAGNVWEWCSDWYSDTYYGVSPVNDPTGPPTGTMRILRGGGWYSDDVLCRTAYRGYYSPYIRRIYCGFRPCVSASAVN